MTQGEGRRLQLAEQHIAVHEERFERIGKSLLLQAHEYRRRLDELNHEAVRIKEIQSTSVTADKFEEYTKTQQRALEVALSSSDSKFTALSHKNAEAIRDLSDRLLRLEESLEARADQVRRESRESDRRAAQKNGWMIAGLGAVMTIMVIVGNLIMTGW